MKIAIPGGTGQVGTVLARAFHGDGHEVVALARSPKPAPWRVAQWDPAGPAGWARELDGADVVINLAGRSVNCRYTPRNRAAILESRVASVRAVGRAIAEARQPPAVWLGPRAGEETRPASPPRSRGTPPGRRPGSPT